MVEHAMQGSFETAWHLVALVRVDSSKRLRDGNTVGLELKLTGAKSPWPYSRVVD
jgi:hypothetical protein